MMSTVSPTAAFNTTPLNDVDTISLAGDMHYATSVYVATFLVVFGVVGNVISIVVWRRNKMTSSTGTYLIGQAVANIGVLVFFFVTDSMAAMTPAIKTTYSYGVFFSYIGFPMYNVFVGCSIWFTVAVTVDRYIQVCWIMHTTVMCRTRRVRMVLVGIALACLAINGPNFFTYKPVHESDRTSSAPGFRLTEFGKSGGMESYDFWVHCMVLVALPWFTILTLNVLIIRQVIMTNTRMNYTRNDAEKERTKRSEAQLTRLLLTLTFVFLLLASPKCAVHCISMVKKGNKQLVSEVYAIAKLGFVINSAINFLLYCVSGRRFRKELISALCGKCTEGQVNSTSLQLSTSTTGSDSTKYAFTNTPSI